MSHWWIDEPAVLGSSDPTPKELERLRDQGFSVLVSLLDENNGETPNCEPRRAQELGYERHSIPIPDYQAPTLEQIREFTELMKSLSPGSKALVHCKGGAGRSGTMGAAYWIARGLTANDAIQKIQKANRHAVETTGQKQALLEFQNWFLNAKGGTQGPEDRQR